MVSSLLPTLTKETEISSGGALPTNYTKQWFQELYSAGTVDARILYEEQVDIINIDEYLNAIREHWDDQQSTTGTSQYGIVEDDNEYLIDEIFVSPPVRSAHIRGRITFTEVREETTFLYDDPDDYLIDE